MVDWELVARLRTGGASWEEIARDPAVEFAADPTGPTAGRQLRALDRSRRGTDPATGTVPPPPEDPKRWSLARIGWLSFALLAPWTFLAFVLPSPVGVYLPLLPILGFAAAAAGALLAFALLRSARKWTETYRTTAMAGAVIGLVIAGSLGGLALGAGCPVLSPFLTGEPGGFQRAPHVTWAEGGHPVLFFFGSVACPYCSASSWAVLGALERLGNVSGVTYDRSSTGDVYPGTPSVVLSDLVVQSDYLTLDARESTSDQQIQAPDPGGCPAQGFVSAYDSFDSIPFVVLGGSFLHVGSLVDPAALQGLTAGQVASELADHQGTAYAAIGPATNLLLAYLVWLNGDVPASVASDPGVAPILAGIH
ncbi:MAG: DUF929 family protein [Thermoplasmata archaeon]